MAKKLREPQASAKTQGGSRKPRNRLGDIENPLLFYPLPPCVGASLEGVRANRLLKTVPDAR